LRLPWLVTIQRERSNIEDYLADSPSLKKYMSDETLLKLYKKARLDAITETGLEMPDHCTYTLNAVLNRPIDL
jgi:hypothetical protein